MADNMIGEVYGQGVPNQTIAGHRMVVGTHFVGIEVELEGILADRFDSRYWNMKGDGSLRNNGQEFVCKGPTGGVDLFNAVVEIDSFLFDKKPDGNWRCSTHVHLDVRDMTASQLKNLIIIYITMEKLIFRLSGFHRYKNNFCCSIGFAQRQLQTLISNWNREDTYDFTNRLINNWDKYSALNLVPISSFGTVEFRMSEPKWRKGKLLLLCNRFLSMKELAKSWTGTQAELVNHLMTTDLYQIFKKGLPREIPAVFEEDLEVGFKLVNDLLVLSQEDPFLGEGGPRNNLDQAKIVWDMLSNGQKKVVPRELYLDNSPRVDIAGTWRQVKMMLDNANVSTRDVMLVEINYSSVRWMEVQLGLQSGTICSPDQRRDFIEYFRANDNANQRLVNEAIDSCGFNGLRNEPARNADVGLGDGAVEGVEPAQEVRQIRVQNNNRNRWAVDFEQMDVGARLADQLRAVPAAAGNNNRVWFDEAGAPPPPPAPPQEEEDEDFVEPDPQWFGGDDDEWEDNE